MQKLIRRLSLSKDATKTDSKKIGTKIDDSENIDSSNNDQDDNNKAALELLANDGDIQVEAQRLEELRTAVHPNLPPGASPSKCPFHRRAAAARSSQPPVPLKIVGRTHTKSTATASLLEEVGGRAAILRMTDTFYKNVFQDKHLDQFFRDHKDPHAQRLADWICEKMGDHAEPWSAERARRPQIAVPVSGGMHVVHDRSSAHVAAWYSTKRPPEHAGQHFKMDDSRVWMRLMFWAGRSTGLFEHGRFAEWYVRFIAHFVKVYEQGAPQFARESARWSESAENTRAYVAGGRFMADVVGVDEYDAAGALPGDEQRGASNWPYDL